MRTWLRLLAATAVLLPAAASCGGSSPLTGGGGGDPERAQAPSARGGGLPASLRMAILKARETAPGHDFAKGSDGVFTGRASDGEGSAEVASTDGGVHLSRAGGDVAGAFELDVETRSVGRRDASAARPVTKRRAEGQELVLTRGAGVEERLLAGPSGLEQSFAVAERPAGRGPLVVEVGFRGLAPELEAGSADRVVLKDASGAALAGYRDLVAADATGRELPGHMEVRGGSVELLVDDEGATYPVTIDPLLWTQQTELSAADGAAKDGFGSAVAMTSGLAVVGAPSHAVGGKAGVGAVYVFAQSGGVWSLQTTLTASDAAASDGFGTAVAAGKGLIAVGAPYHTTGVKTEAGAVYVFAKNGAIWTQQQELTAGDMGAFDGFGTSVALDGATVLAGAPEHKTAGHTEAGAAYVFTQCGTTWAQQQELTAADAALGDLFGYSVALSGDTALVGAYQHDVGGSVSAGAAYVYTRAGATWAQQQQLTAGDKGASDFYGYAVALDHDTAVVGALQHDTVAGASAGAAYVYLRTGATFALQQELTAVDGAAGDFFGASVAVAGDTLTVGAPAHTIAAKAGAGAAYELQRNAVTWTLAQETTAGDGAPGDGFGQAVALGGGSSLVGAPAHAVAGKAGAGVAYVFLGSAAGSCYVDGYVVASGGQNPSDPCQVCDAQASPTAWTNRADGTPCGGGSVCTDGSCAGTCTICGITRAVGTPNPANPCEACRPTVATGAWSPLADGASCGAGKVCNADACQSGCYIAGAFVAAGAANPVNACQVCAPAASTSAYTNLADGTGCGAGKVCSSGGCASDCFIAGVLYGAGTVNPANPCQSCAPAASTTAWTNATDGSACAPGEVCSSGTCASDCFIAGVLYTAGTPNPANACQLCTPASSTVMFSNEPDGSSCGSGLVCAGGACSSDCFIGGAVVTAGAVNPADPCQVCAPGASTTAWTNKSDGTACGAAQVCSSGSCASDCFIAGVLYSAGTVNPANPCQSCAPATSTTAWTNATDGSACAPGEVCSSGGCASDCFIAGVLYGAGTVNPANPCQSCAPATSTTAWSNATDGSACAMGEVCASGACTADCFIAGALIPGGTVSPTNPCQECRPSSSTVAWSNRSDGTTCDDGDACTFNDSCAAGACGGTSHACAPGACEVSSTCDGKGGCTVVDKLVGAPCPDDGNPCSSDACDGAGACKHPALADGTACAAGEVCQAGSCGAECFIGGVLVPAGTINPLNPCETCAPATSTTAWSHRSDGTTCDDGDACTSNDVCAAGACQGTAHACAPTACQATAICDGKGGCTITNKAMGAPCADDGNPCTTDACDGAGACAHPALPDGVACMPGEVCQAGSCGAECFIGGALVPSGTINPLNPCETCAPATSTTAWSNRSDGATCDDGDACTSNDVCAAGVCKGDAHPCTPADCQASSVCDGKGGCTVATEAAGAVCTDDGNPCTADACDDSGLCAHPALADGTACGAGMVCAAGACAQQCFIDGKVVATGTVNPTNACQACAPATSTSGWSSVADGSSCDDGNACTKTDVCQAGACVAGKAVTCAPLDECHLAGACAPATGDCDNPVAPDGTDCSGGACQAGVCTATTGSGTGGAGGSSSASSGAGGAAGVGGAGGSGAGGSTGIGGSTGTGGDSGEGGSTATVTASSSSGVEGLGELVPGGGGCACRATGGAPANDRTPWMLAASLAGLVLVRRGRRRG